MFKISNLDLPIVYRKVENVAEWRRARGPAAGGAVAGRRGHTSAGARVGGRLSTGPPARPPPRRRSDRHLDAY